MTHPPLPRRPRPLDEAERLADSISTCFSNVSTLPKWMQAPALGRNMRPLVRIAARAVLTSGWLAEHDAAVRAEARDEALREAASYLRGHGGMRFDEHGPRDTRGAALWDAGCAIDPADGAALATGADEAPGGDQ